MNGNCSNPAFMGLVSNFTLRSEIITAAKMSTLFYRVVPLRLYEPDAHAWEGNGGGGEGVSPWP